MTFLLLLSSLLWGSNVVIMRYLLNEASSSSLIQLRLLISMMTLGFVLLYRKSFYISFKTLSQLAMVSFFNISLNYYFTFKALEVMEGRNVALMNALTPTILFLFNHFFFKESINNIDYLSIFLTLTGFLVSIQFNLFTLSLSHLYSFIGLISYAFSTLLLKRLNTLDSFKATFYMLLFGFLSSFVYGSSVFEIHLSFFSWALLIMVSGIGFAFIQYCIFEGSKQVGLIKTSFILNLNPCFTYLFSILFLKEKITVSSFLGLFLMTLGLVIKIKKNR